MEIDDGQGIGLDVALTGTLPGGDPDIARHPHRRGACRLSLLAAC